VNDEVRSVLVGTAGLGGAALAAAALTITRGGVRGDDAQVQRTARLVAVVVLVQAAHFAEELATGFHRRFPELLGLVAWSSDFFVWFNLVWLAVWALSIGALLGRRHIALFPLWFLGIAGVANGVAHPALSARTGGYFPGLLTSPLVGVGGLLLLRRLALVTRGRASPA
jgi:hypothetical protein